MSIFAGDRFCREELPPDDTAVLGLRVCNRESSSLSHLVSRTRKMACGSTGTHLMMLSVSVLSDVSSLRKASSHHQLMVSVCSDSGDGVPDGVGPCRWTTCAESIAEVRTCPVRARWKRDIQKEHESGEERMEWTEFMQGSAHAGCLVLQRLLIYEEIRGIYHGNEIN